MKCIRKVKNKICPVCRQPLKTNLRATIKASRQTTPVQVNTTRGLEGDDEDLRRAIEESLELTQQYDADDDFDFKRAIKESMKPAHISKKIYVSNNEDEEFEKALMQSLIYM